MEQLYSFFSYSLMKFIKSQGLSFKCQNLHFYIGRILAELNNSVDSSLSQRSFCLIYELDLLTKLLTVLKDESALKEDQIRQITRNDYLEALRDNKISLQNFNNRFHDYKVGMTLDMKNYIEDSKQDSLKQLKKKVIEIKGFIM
jgi:hypothetical protein